MKVNFILIKFKDMDIMFGPMEENMKVCGKIIKCMVKVFLAGQMEENMKDSIHLIKNKEEGYLLGQMEELMMDNGKMENKKVKEFISLKMVCCVKEFGKMVKKFVGLVIPQLKKQIECLKTNDFFEIFIFIDLIFLLNNNINKVNQIKSILFLCSSMRLNFIISSKVP
jgi:hypothetical protein